MSPGHYEYKEWYIVKDDENEDTRGEAGFLWYANHPDLGEYWARTKSDILEIIKQVEDNTWQFQVLIWADPGQTDP